jgi:hypothetical protein
VKDWTYGRGVEGVYDPTREAGQVTLLGGGMPWWSPVIRRIGLTPTLNIVSGEGPLAIVKTMCPGAECLSGPTEVEKATKEPPRQARETRLLLCQGRSPPYKSGWWKLPKLELVVSDGSAGGRIPAGWSLYRSQLDHSRSGGATAYTATLTIHVRNDAGAREFWEAPYPERPGQDLRWSLKMGRSSSTRVEAPPFVPQPAGSEVIMFEAKELSGIEAHGLFPKSLNWKTQVRALLGGDFYFLRELEATECLHVLDVPERYFKHSQDEERRALIGLMTHPLKIMQEVAERIDIWVTRRANPAPTSNKRTREVSEVKSVNQEEAIQKRMKSQTDEAPEERPTQEEGERDAKATKADNARIPIEIWDSFLERGLPPVITKRDWKSALVVLRKYFHRRWIRNVTRSYTRWRRNCGWPVDEVEEADAAARDAIERATNTTWWKWKRGSRPFFWRWPTEFIKRILRGTKPWFRGNVPAWEEPQQLPKDKAMADKMVAKLRDVLEKGYLEEGKVTSLMFFFAVEKNDDIRMVYDGTKSGLNDATWAPWFPLPIVEDLLDAVEPGTFMGDNDVGEMFLNFIMHSDLRELCGIDLTDFMPEGSKDPSTLRFCVRWNRNAMGLKGSPYFSVQGGAWAHEWIKGRRDDEDNVFRWTRVSLNLPGQADYNPSKIWVRKERADGTLASDLVCYVDDERVTGPSLDDSWKATQRVSSGCAYLGLQDAARKRRAPSQAPGSWAGSDVHSTDQRVSVLISQDRWNKMKGILRSIKEEMTEVGGMDHKELERNRGRLVYATRGYNAMKPYLKGIHLTLDSWRRGRDHEGWKMKPGEIETEVDWNIRVPDLMRGGHEDSVTSVSPAEAPKRVRAVARLSQDIEALLRLTKSDTPIKVLVRPEKVVQVIYGFGDASGRGWGASILLPDGSVYYKSGSWVEHLSKRSSNFRELANLVYSLREAGEKGLLEGCEVFMFTDNTTAERAFFRGTSKSRLLFDLILELRDIEMKVGARIHLVHVAGTRMIYQGTDGLSRGDQNAGVMTGESFLSHIPLHLGCLEREPKLHEWIESWAKGAKGGPPKFLTPEDWFLPHASGGCFVWTPPPAAARRAIFCLGQSILKRSNSVHVVVIPRLMTALWRKVLEKTCDVSFTVPVGTVVWGSEEHEPLVLTIALPLSRDPPWRHKRADSTVDCEAEMHGVWKADFARSGSLLRELVDGAWKVAEV